MTKLLNLVLTVSICLGFIQIQAQFTRQQAINKVLTEIVKDDISNSNIFAEYVSRSNQDHINLL
jgi:hypothetical protein